MTLASPWMVARSVRPPTLTGSVIETATFAFASMCWSLRLKSVDEVMNRCSPSYNGMSG
jgi:hypothetical protein